MDAEFVRQWAARDKGLIRAIAEWVMAKRCQCCGAPWVEQMECGHFRCELCEIRDHICLACALAM